jgi:hypothetical protein
LEVLGHVQYDFAPSPFLILRVFTVYLLFICLADLHFYFVCFRGQPHHSSQQDGLDGPSPWVPWAPETFENPFKLFSVSEASHIIPASRIGWMGQARGRRGPQKHSKTLSNFFLFQRPATSFQPAGSVGWAKPVGAAGPRNIRKPAITLTKKPLYQGTDHRTLISYRMLNCLCHIPPPWNIYAVRCKTV